MIVHLVDGTYELFRHFYGLRRFTKTDRPLGAVVGVLQSVLEMIEQGATHVGVATDHVIESFRNDLWPGYKTGAGIEPALWAQFHPLEEALVAMGIVTWPMVELEADDALASAARIAAADPRVEKVCIWTPDKDLAQCVVGNRVVQVDRKSGQIRDADAVVANALRQVLVGRPDADVLDRCVFGSDACRRGECIVSLELDHRPGDHAHRDQRLLERMELRPQRRLDALPGLVARPELVAERLDHVVGGNADVGRALLDHLEHRLQHTDHRAERPVAALSEAAQAVEMAEQLVGAVDQMDDHRHHCLQTVVALTECYDCRGQQAFQLLPLAIPIARSATRLCVDRAQR